MLSVDFVSFFFHYYCILKAFWYRKFKMWWNWELVKLTVGLIFSWKYKRLKVICSKLDLRNLIFLSKIKFLVWSKKDFKNLFFFNQIVLPAFLVYFHLNQKLLTHQKRKQRKFRGSRFVDSEFLKTCDVKHVRDIKKWNYEFTDSRI